eukprot:1525097-Rhodomonas_salina.2
MLLHHTSTARVVLLACLLQFSSAYLISPSQLVVHQAKNNFCATKPAVCVSPMLRSSAPAWSMALASAKKAKKSALEKALHKPSGLSVTVSVEYSQEAEKNALEREILSCQLRKEKVASLWVDRETLSAFCSEQRAAKGDFPGPCPVVLREPATSSADLEFVKEAGSSAVVIAASAENAGELAEEAEKLGLTTVWEVTNKEQAAQAAEAGAGIFLVSAAAAAKDDGSLVSALPPKSVWVAEIAAMQPGNNEIGEARAVKAQGCKAMLVSKACVGDVEDLPYARYVVTEMASKASSEFKITGMTGHVNGHYGTGTFEKGDSERMWKRGKPE